MTRFAEANLEEGALIPNVMQPSSRNNIKNGINIEEESNPFLNN